jgi:AraC-like DNA-binding protein
MRDTHARPTARNGLGHQTRHERRDPTRQAPRPLRTRRCTSTTALSSPPALPPALRASARRDIAPGSCTGIQRAAGTEAEGPVPKGRENTCGEEKARYLPLSRTTEAVLQMLLCGDLSRLRAESVAEALGISCTTLRRRLREDHTNYQFLLDRARQYRCETLLQERWLPGKCLADELGYLEINSFYRAFQRWTGISYSAYRTREP